MHGWIILDKPLGLGSTQGVSAVKRCLRQGGYGKGIKVGHGGTLDPLATGVLPIAVGEATKLAGRMLDSDKVYDFTIRFGAQTSTLDAEGEVVATSDVRPTRTALEAVLPRFTGPIDQVPPAYSALKVDGERAYDLARAGEEVVLASRAVTIYALISSPERGGGPFAPANGGGGEPLGESLADAPLHHPSDGPPPRAGEDWLEEITLTAHVSKGTYIRSLARDIALALGTVGHVTMLRRIKAGPFTLAPAISLDKLNEMGQARTLEQILLPLRAGLDDIPALALDPDQAGALRQGRVLAGIAVDDGQYFAMLGDIPVALVEALDEQVRVVRGFNLD
ncbi:tRNA pseudouridine(55) synthase TruB [Sphingomonas sp. Sph1(2015)]|jgi:tRNA pseudouridine55 synthase|uniref:tRNA pseudouridine(55) synthase TruB n=1 Tax=Sphingomonas sp. Sph1(2015) TaxID=1628084 RepID=UPI000976B602|nr:tRNA pseudouridine(55) synthase TruB [Sphingomonas sp. Sph1(2015)]OMJ32846.1 tRNA pseudouridine(55) synthase TruB [Sphingomonas sp. Sph1(2015)]